MTTDQPGADPDPRADAPTPVSDPAAPQQHDDRPDAAVTDAPSAPAAPQTEEESAPGEDTASDPRLPWTAAPSDHDSAPADPPTARLPHVPSPSPADDAQADADVPAAPLPPLPSAPPTVPAPQQPPADAPTTQLSPVPATAAPAADVDAPSAPTAPSPSPWAPPGYEQPSPGAHPQSSYGQPPYGQPPYGPANGQQPYAQLPYGQPPQGQPPYGQPPYGQPGAPGAPGAPAAQWSYPPGTTPPAWGAPPPPPASKPPLTRADWLRAAAVGLLNLSGLGLGYAAIRRWLALGVALAATVVLLVIALPADANGVPAAVVAVYGAALVAFALHGGWRALRAPALAFGRPLLAAVLGVVLLAVPATGSVLYGDWHHSAVLRKIQAEQLADLARADGLVRSAAAQASFSAAEPDYQKAFGVYHELLADAPHSKAGTQVPQRLNTFYNSVAKPYAAQQYCDAVTPLTYLRGLPKTVGSLQHWPDARLATSLLDCGTQTQLGVQGQTGNGDLDKLLSWYPDSPQAAKVEPAVKSAVAQARAATGKSGGSAACTETDVLKTLVDQAGAYGSAAPGQAAALKSDTAAAKKGITTGTFACGTHQYQTGDYTEAQNTMSGFAKDYPHDGKAALAKKYVIAAEVAQYSSAAGKVKPTTASGGSIEVTFKNDSPLTTHLLYSGPVIGSITLGACGSCKSYGSDAQGHADACKSSGKHYPQKTVYLPAGTVFVMSNDASVITRYVDTMHLDHGYLYTECWYNISG